MRSVITTGKTVEDAILAAAIQLAVQRDKLEIEILEEPVKACLEYLEARMLKSGHR